MSKYVLKIENVSKIYARGTEKVHAVNDASLSIKSGEYCSVMGPSGSGKTTLMNIMGCLDRPSKGSVFVNSVAVEKMLEKKLNRIRQNSIGFVFQQFFLIPTLNVLENVQLPSLFAKSQSEGRARELLQLVGLENRLSHYPGELSGGEMQRVAIARSLINSPPILLADEPTGNLDSKNAENIMSLFEELNTSGITIVVVTHNPELANRCERTFKIEDGDVRELD